jgi:hypothetical protein
MMMTVKVVKPNNMDTTFVPEGGNQPGTNLKKIMSN